MAFLSWRNYTQNQPRSKEAPLNRQEREVSTPTKRVSINLKKVELDSNFPKRDNIRKRSHFAALSPDPQPGSSKRELMVDSQERLFGESPIPSQRVPKRREIELAPLNDTRRGTQEKRGSQQVPKYPDIFYSKKDDINFIPLGNHITSSMKSSFKNSIVIFDIKNTNYFLNAGDSNIQPHPFFVGESSSK